MNVFPCLFSYTISQYSLFLMDSLPGFVPIILVPPKPVQCQCMLVIRDGIRKLLIAVLTIHEMHKATRVTVNICSGHTVSFKITIPLAYNIVRQNFKIFEDCEIQVWFTIFKKIFLNYFYNISIVH